MENNIKEQEKFEFKEWPKIYRFNREIIVTEKIDGTNAQICIGEDGTFLVGSRTRWITPEDDNHGFAYWAYEHKEELMKLGEGRHYGEWWGNSIQRGYGCPTGDKRFSLFNIIRWTKTPPPDCCSIVPVLYQGMFSEEAIKQCLLGLKHHGSRAIPFMNPEGIVVYHTQANMCFKITIEGDEYHKSERKIRIEAPKTEEAN
jgi:hypothetical protein